MPWQEALNQHLTPKRQRTIFVVLLVLYALFLSYKITNPFIGTSEAWNGMFGISAMNWLRLGPINLKFAQMTPYSPEKILPEVTKTYFLNHPNFYIAPTAISYFFFGTGEWQTRLGPIVMSLLSFIFFWLLIKRAFKNPALTAISSVFFIFFPVGIYYGRMLTQEPITMPFTLALFLAAIAFKEEKKRKYLFLLSLAAFLGGLMDWPFFFASAAVFGYVALKRDYPDRGKTLLALIAASAAALGVTLLQIWAVADTNPFSFLYALFGERTAGPSIFFLYLFMRSNFDLINFSEVALILTIIGLIYYIKAYKKDVNKILFLLLLSSVAVLNYAVFYTHAATHQFIGLYFAAPIALLAAWGLYRLRCAWIVVAALVLFMVSSLWYAENLFAHKSFAEDDFLMFKRANAAVPIEEPICMGENAVNMNVKFYLFPHQMNNAPCPTESYFILRKPDSFLKRDPEASLLQSFFSGSFLENLRRVSFAAASGVEIVKSVPALKEKVENIFEGHDPHADYARQAEKLQNFIDENGLTPLDCSTNFCLYKKSAADAI